MLDKLRWLESNIWKSFVFGLTHRRNYISLLSIYFLTFPDNTVKQIGLYTWIWSLASFLFEIPSGYLADRFGHKNVLILAKILMVLTTLSFILWDNVYWFIAGSVFLALAFACTSWTMSAFMHETVVWLDREKEYTKITSRISGNVSLVSVLFIVALPFLTQISFELPFYVWLVLDVIWLIVALSLVKPKENEEIKKAEHIVQVVKKTKWSMFWNVAIFTAVLGGIMHSDHAFRIPYVESLGYPVVLIWLIMWTSRLVWFGVSRITHKLEEIFTIKQLLFIEIFMFAIWYLLISYFNNPYIVWLIISIIGWYRLWRWPIFRHYLIKQIPDKKYKATMLSVKNQLSSIVSLILVFILWYIMNYSYKIGYLTIWVVLFVSLMTIYILKVRKIEE